MKRFLFAVFVIGLGTNFSSQEKLLPPPLSKTASVKDTADGWYLIVSCGEEQPPWTKGGTSWRKISIQAWSADSSTILWERSGAIPINVNGCCQGTDASLSCRPVKQVEVNRAFPMAPPRDVSKEELNAASERFPKNIQASCIQGVPSILYHKTNDWNSPVLWQISLEKAGAEDGWLVSCEETYWLLTALR